MYTYKLTPIPRLDVTLPTLSKDIRQKFGASLAEAIPVAKQLLNGDFAYVTSDVSRYYVDKSEYYVAIENTQSSCESSLVINTITVDMLDAIKVQFLKPIFEDDFPERGMTAWLTKIDRVGDCWKLYFDFTEFEAINDKYFVEAYNYSSKQYRENGGVMKGTYTAKEAGEYRPKYSVMLDVGCEPFDDKIKKYLRVAE